MQVASDELKELLSKRRNYPAKLRVTFGITNTEIKPNSTITTNSQTYFSDVNYITSGASPLNNYQTLEPGSWILGNGGLVLPISDWNKTGLTSEFMSTSDGTFVNNPIIVIEGIQSFSLLGLTIRFDVFRNNWCDFTVRTYLNSALQKTYNAYADGADFIVDEQFDDWNRMELEFTRTSIPYRRLRISNLEFGVYRVDTVFESAESASEVSPISDKLPTTSFEWTLFNFDQEFQPGQDTGIQKYLMDQQPVKYEWGYPLNDGTIEWVLGNTLLTTGDPSFPKDRVTLTATDTLSYCTDIYRNGIYSPSGISLYDLADDVLLKMSLPLNDDGTYRWRLWDGLKAIYTTAPLPKEAGRNCLQLIANAGGCVFLPDRTGNIVISPIDVYQTDLTIDYSMQTSSNAEVTQNPPLYSVIVGVGSYTLKAISELHSSTISIYGTEIVPIEYSESTNISATVSGGTLVNAKYYAAYAELTITANGSVAITVNGQNIERSEWNYEKQYGSSGEDLPWSNVLCTNVNTAETIAKFVGDFYVGRSIYSADYIGHPLIDSLDRIWTENDFDEKKSSLVIAHTLVYNGSWKGSLKWSN